MTNMFEAWEIYDYFQGHLTRAKKRLITYLYNDGYLFIANDSRLMDETEKWRKHDPIQIASAHKSRPRYLWAVKL